MRARLPADPVERVSLLAGVILAVSALAILALIGRVDASLAAGLALQWGAHLAIGKETGIPAGLAAGVPAPLSALAAFSQDAVTLLLGYPLVMAVGRGTLRIPLLDRWIHRPHDRRDRFAARTERAGIALLAAGLWLPFVPAGALTAALAGRIAGYRMQWLIPALVVSALLSSVVYAALFSAAARWAGDARLMLALALGVALIGLAIGWLRRPRPARA